jgi:hypothetical protein
VAVGATEFIDKTIADGIFSPDVWSKQVLRASESNLVIANSVNRGFEDDASVGKSVKVASIGNLAARAKAENTAITYEAITETVTTIVLNIWSYAAVGIEDIVKVQAAVDVQNEYQRKLGYAVARDVDTKLATAFAGFSRSVGTLGTAVSDANVLAAVKLLDDADVPQDDRYFIMTPAEKVAKLALDRWSNALYVGTSNLPVKNGVLGEMYGLTLKVTTNLVKPAGGQANNAIFHRDALALVMQRTPKTHVFYDIDFFTWKLASEVIYGYQEMRDDYGVLLLGAS